ncbi:carboxy terminal-processing peptidase [Puniceicoccaceae bacterium K14]|nr:carboxy terminal-processing peptidase [Puniceicoccaceae bacterium K14]
MLKKTATLLTFVTLTSILALNLFADESVTNETDLPLLEPRPLMTQETQRVIEMLETIHFKNEEIRDERFTELIEEYMEALDLNKIYFLESHVQKFTAEYGDMLGFQLRNQGDLSVAFEIFEVYRDRALQKINWAIEELKKDWEFDKDETYSWDRDETPWPKTSEDADTVWIQRLKYELLHEILNEKEIEEARETVTKRYERMIRNIKEIGPSDVQEIFLTKLTQMFDPHSTFFSADSFEDFNIQMRLSLVGIGALLSEEDGYCVIKEVIAGGPAKRDARLKKEDRIVKVGQAGGEPVDIIGLSLRKIVDQIRGEKGTVVDLTIIPADAVDVSEREVISIVRDTVRINSSRCHANIFQVPHPEVDGETVPMGVIEIPTFYGSDEIDDEGNRVITSVSADVEELVIKMMQAGVKGIVLDLRNNGGGLLNEAIDMTGLFISRGPVVQVKDPYGKVWPQGDRNPKLVYTGPLAVLTSKYSASASEIVAGALQNYGRAIIIGNESTHGKGTVQQIYSLENYVFKKLLSEDKAGATKLTVRKFYLPNGFSTQKKGVHSDIWLPSVSEILADGEADLPNALSWDYVKPAGSFAEKTLNRDFVEDLIKNSQERQKELEEFQFLNQRIEWVKEREERKEISLNLEKRKVLMETEKEFSDGMKDEQRRLAELNFEAEELKLESVIALEDSEEEQEETQASTINEPVGGETDDLVASVDGASTTEATDEEEEEEEVPDFDIQLRETLRIMVDAVEKAPDPIEWSEPASPIAAKSRFETLVN